MNENIYPVVIVGKDRTRMTCEVVRHLHEKLLNCDPHFIIVSDRSRVGHCEAIRGFFQRELSGVGFEILVTSSDRFGWGAAMNIGLERAFQISDSAILVDNDWILQRTILVDHLAEVLRSTPMGCVSFKAIPKNHDYMIQERVFGNFKFDVRTETAAGIFSGGRPNYVVEIGYIFFQSHHAGACEHNLQSWQFVVASAQFSAPVRLFEDLVYKQSASSLMVKVGSKVGYATPLKIEIVHVDI